MYHLEIAAVYGIVKAERQVTGMAKRIGSVDILKALGICSVILYHTEALPTVVDRILLYAAVFLCLRADFQRQAA